MALPGTARRLARRTHCFASTSPKPRLRRWRGDDGDPVLAERVRMVRDHGSKVRYGTMWWAQFVDELQAAILGVKLRYLDGERGGA